MSVIGDAIKKECEGIGNSLSSCRYCDCFAICRICFPHNAIPSNMDSNDIEDMILEKLVKGR